MKRLLMAGVFAIIACCMGVLGGVRAIEGEPPTDVSLLWKSDDLTAEEATCTGTWQTIKVKGRGEKRACAQGGEVSLATYEDGSYSRAALKAGFAMEYVALEGVCEQWRRCAYSSQTDTLVTQRDGENGKPRTIAYRHFFQKLRFESFPSARYVHERSEPDIVVASQIDTGAIALSANGRWLALEAMDKGTLVFDVQQGSLRRVNASGYRYGLGMNPQQEMAISEDGSKLVVTGWNSGFRIMFLTDGCGELVGDEVLEPSLSDTSRECRQTDALIGERVPGFRYGTSPKFLADGMFLSLRAGVSGVPSQRLMFRLSSAINGWQGGYLALGDSFTSGEGEESDDWYVPPTQTKDDPCHVSRRAYPALVGQYLGLAAHNIACSGAVMTDVYGLGAYDGQGGRLSGLADASLRRQEAASSLIPGRLRQSELVVLARPQLVSLSIGGNDAGLFDKVRVCAMPGTCHWAHKDMKGALREEVRSLYDRLLSTIRGVQQNVPDARLVVIGYPMPIEVDGICDPLFATLLNAEERLMFTDIVHNLNDVTKSAASKAGVQFIDVEGAYKGTALCAARNTPMSINGLRMGDDLSFRDLFIGLGAESFHPTPYGHQLAASVIYKQLAECRNGCAQDTGFDEEINAEEPVLRAASLVRASCQQSCRIETGRGLFRPGSEVAISLRSQPTSIGSVVASSVGGVAARTVIPETISEGYHTLILEGEMADGVSVRYYQAVMVERGGDVRLSNAPSQSIGAANSGVSSPLGRPQVEGADVLGVGKGQSADRATTAFAEKPWGGIFWHMIVVVLVAAGIMTVWLLSVRLLRK